MSKLNQRKIIQMFALGFLLVLLPAGSWYYLKMGFNYRLQALETLADKGETPVMGKILTKDEAISADHISGKVLVSTFYALDQSDKREKIGQLQKGLYKQFGKRDDVLLLNYIMTDPGATEQDILSFQESYDLMDTSRVYFLPVEAESFKSSLLPAFQFTPEEIAGIDNNPLFALTDAKQKIRNTYRFNDAEIVKLIEHTAIVLPREKEKDIVLKRDAEK